MVAAVVVLVAVAGIEFARLLRDARRQRRLNGALHELRRPLQAIALAISGDQRTDPGAEACLVQARRAMEDLDAVINGRRPAMFVRRATIGEVIGDLATRWRFADVEIQGVTGDVRVDADVDRLGAALDNLVANALRHGSGIVSVRVSSGGGKARFEVRDDGPRRNALTPVRDPRHGHGLALAAGTAERCGGSLDGPSARPGGGTIASISLPVAGGGGA